MKISKDHIFKFKEYIKETFEVNHDSRNRQGCVLDIAKFSNKICPIAACFIIEPSNKEQISSLNKIDSFRHILFNSFASIPRATCIKSEQILHKNIESFINKVPVFKYEYALDNNKESIIKFLDKNSLIDCEIR